MSKGNVAPTVFTKTALTIINKPYLIEALIVLKANEGELIKILAENKLISDKAVENLEKSNIYTDLAKLKGDLEAVVGALKKLKYDAKLKEGNYAQVEQEQISPSSEVLNVESNLVVSEKSEFLKNKIVKLDSNTPIFSNKPGDRLDEWLFVLNNAFSCLKVTDSVEKLKLATTYVRGPVLQSLIRYQNEDTEAEWGGFTELLKDLYEPRNQELMLRAQLRHFRQKDTFANYLNKFQELTNRMVKLSDNDKFVAFLDGLSDVYKHEVLKVPTCNTVREAILIPIVLIYGWC